MNTEIELISQKNEDERREQAKKATMGMNGRLSGILLQYTSNDYYKSLSLKRNETKKKTLIISLTAHFRTIFDLDFSAPNKLMNSKDNNSKLHTRL